MKTTTVKKGNRTYRYLSLVEAVREEGKVRHRVLARLGEAEALRSSGQLDRIMGALRDHAEGRWLSAGELEAGEAPAVGGTAAVAAYWERFGLGGHFDGVAERRGLGYSLSDAVLAMVANRLLAPSSKRRLPEWVSRDVVMPEEFSFPTLDQYYWALDQVARAKPSTETHLYSRLTDLTNLDLRLVCYDLTSTYFCGSRRSSHRFPSRAFGYSRDHRGDRPQVVIGLLQTSDGIPLAHHVFSGDTADVSTMPEVLSNLQARFGVGKVCLVADRGLISEGNLEAIGARGFDHVIATRLHNSHQVAAVLEAAARPETVWEPVPGTATTATNISLDGQRYVVARSQERFERDRTRTTELVARTEAELLRLEDRVRAGRLKNQTKIAQAAGRILAGSGVARLFEVEVGEGRFLYHYDEEALDYEEDLLAGRYVLSTSLTTDAASAADVVVAYRRLMEVESTFRVLKDLIALRPVYHWTESRVRGHIGVCVLAATFEALIEADLRRVGIADPDLPHQTLSTRRALRELNRIRRLTIDTGAGSGIGLVTRRSALQAQILTALEVDPTSWGAAHSP